jgi:hypothetical protein
VKLSIYFVTTIRKQIENCMFLFMLVRYIYYNWTHTHPPVLDGYKEELLHALMDKGTFAKILKQGAEAPEVSGYIRTYLAENQGSILNYFMNMNDKVNLEEL